MTDYTFETDVLRGKVADAIADNTEQFLFVVTNAVIQVDLDEALELGELGDECDDREELVARLRHIALAIEKGGVS